MEEPEETPPSSHTDSTDASQQSDANGRGFCSSMTITINVTIKQHHPHLETPAAQEAVETPASSCADSKDVCQQSEESRTGDVSSKQHQLHLETPAAQVTEITQEGQEGETGQEKADTNDTTLSAENSTQVSPDSVDNKAPVFEETSPCSEAVETPASSCADSKDVCQQSEESRTGDVSSKQHHLHVETPAAQVTEITQEGQEGETGQEKADVNDTTVSAENSTQVSPDSVDNKAPVFEETSPCSEAVETPASSCADSKDVCQQSEESRTGDVSSKQHQLHLETPAAQVTEITQEGQEGETGQEKADVNDTTVSAENSTQVSPDSVDNKAPVFEETSPCSEDIESPASSCADSKDVCQQSEESRTGQEGDTGQEKADTNYPAVCVENSVEVLTDATNKVADPVPVPETQLQSLLEDLGLTDYYPEKLFMRKILQIDEKTITDERTKCNSDLPWYFLKKLMMVNGKARNVKLTCKSTCDASSDGKGSDSYSDLDLYDLLDSLHSADSLNPLDIITALFLCSDGFVQQELALKMSMCQFSVPLLLPNCDTNQSTLMLWAMRDIVKKYRPSSLSQSKGFIEDRIVVSELPMISFVRLGECSLSKSETLNKLLSNSQQNHDTFIHHNMTNGDCPRKISNGLTEISWYLPCGNENMDIFSEPVAVANLRGDIASFEAQFAFLCQTSAAVFVFFDNLDSDCSLLSNEHHKAEIFLVVDQKNKHFSVDALKKVGNKLNLTNSQILVKTKKMNDADFVEKLHEKVNGVVEKPKMKMQIQQMTEIACNLGILVDEDHPACQTAKVNADAITSKIQDILQYKEAQLPLQGQIWKDLTNLEKEEFRLKNLGSQNIEIYKSDLQKQKEKLRNKQNSYDMSNAMTCFISAISSPGIERCYFLKWMRMNLDDLSREKLSGLREAYKNKDKTSADKEEIKNINKQLSNSSLGLEHFFREMGQIYEASLSLPETNSSRRQFQHLPRLCAELLLEGFPLELVDGDASNIPLTWVRDVLTQLNDLVSPKNKILVVTVLGVQSTGKSTLLNTMFGVQFAVSSGRCTRGAFMLLIRVSEDLKEELNCDFILIIDTEGLKSPELAKLDNSFEHDNELATLVVGLSDITIINIAMENSTEMKDILQIVVHAFLRMKEVGKKPKCQFVHQNVSDVSANDKNLREREMLLQQLNEMTQAAARMEKKEENKTFTDVMEYDPETGNQYIPGLWNGVPPMAPVNAGYSEAVYELKKNIINILGKHESSANNFSEFTEWITSLWNAVKHENFIFSFRNSLVAEEYMRLCTEFNKWEWEFKQEMYKWTKTSEIKLSNFGRVKSEESDIDDLLTKLKRDATSELSKCETKLLNNLEEYFKQPEGHVHLIEAYREDFANSAKSLRREMQSSVYNQLTVATDVRRGMTEIDEIKVKHRKDLGERVRALIEDCRKKKVNMTDEMLDEEFEKMWKKMLEDQDLYKPKVMDVSADVDFHLRQNLSHKGSHVCKLLSKKTLQDCGGTPFRYSAHGIDYLKNKLNRYVWNEDKVKMLQEQADLVINECTQFVKTKENYHPTFIQEILHMIDERLENIKDVKPDTDFEVSLKQHICGAAAREFQKVHQRFIQKNDPLTCLNQNKETFLGNFKDEFHKRDICQQQAEKFTNLCLKPAVEKSIISSLGPDIIRILTSKYPFSARTFFQYELLLDLLSKDKFEDYLSYICSYGYYAKNWIRREMLKLLSNESLSQFEDQHLWSSVNSVNDAVQKAQATEGGNLEKLIQDIRQELGEKLEISEDALDPFMMLKDIDQKQFAQYLTELVKNMADSLKDQFTNTNIQKKIEKVDVKLQNEFFTKLIGCGKQCPFCKAPCDADSPVHKEHFSNLHRPDGLGRYRWEHTEKLSIDICTSLVSSDCRFRCDDTNNESHPYKEYTKIYPDWRIPPDRNLEDSDYWKYVLNRFNKEFAQVYKAKEAEIPDTWRKISKDQAEKSLKRTFNVPD